MSEPTIPRKSPVLVAKEITDEGMPGGIFEQALWLHHEYGYVSSGPEYFLMGRPVRRDAQAQELADLTYRFEKPDAWYVWVMAGDLVHAFAAMPYLLQWTGFRRKLKSAPHLSGPVHWHETIALRREIYEQRVRARGTLIG